MLFDDHDELCEVQFVFSLEELFFQDVYCEFVEVQRHVGKQLFVFLDDLVEGGSRGVYWRALFQFAQAGNIATNLH
jgi:hypothetical protein